MLDHGQGLVGVGAGDDSHVAVAFAHRRLINQKHRAAAAAAMLGYEPRPGPPVAWAGTATRGHLVGLWWRPQGQPLPHQLAEPSTLILYVPMLARPACSLTVASM